MKHPERPRFRKNLLIYPRFQLTLIVANALAIAAILGLVGIQLMRSFAHLRQLGLDAKLPPTHAYFRFIEFQSSTMLSYLALAFVAGIALTALFTLVLSHRLAGPIVRLRGYFSEIAQGRAKRPVVPLKFRKGDFFSELPEVVNGAIAKLGERDETPSRQGGDHAA